MSVAIGTGPARAAGVAAPLVGTPIVQAAPTPADKPVTAGAQPTANRFAELLRRSRAEAPRPAAAERAPAARADAGGDSGEAGDAASIEVKAAPGNAAKARAATPRAPSERASGEDEDPRSDTSVAVRTDEGGDDGGRIDRTESTPSPVDRLDPRALPAMAIDTLRRGASANPAGMDDATGSTAKDRDPSAAVGKAPGYGLGHARGMTAVDAADDRRTAPANAARDSALRIAAGAGLPLALGDGLPTFDPSAATPAHDPAVDVLAASLGVGAAPLGADPAAATSAATTLALATPVDAPDFATALGLRVSVLVQDGVQQAELHLNPAETGPVSIHISLDGTAARVDFGADVAATRAAIERGLPELASALRDAGFTLAGGGVSQHAGGRASGEDEAKRAAARPGAGGDAASTSVAVDPRRVPRAIVPGAVDLYA